MSNRTLDAAADRRIVPTLSVGSRRRYALLGAAALLSVGAAALGQRWWAEWRFLESTDDAYVGGDVTVVAPKVAGLIAEVAVTDNQAVHVGDLLVRLDDRDFRAALDRATAAVAGHLAALEHLEATRMLQQSVIRGARASVIAAEAENERARDDKVRYQALAALAAASVQASQKADAAFKTAEASLEHARSSLETAERGLAVIAAQKNEEQAALAAAEAERETARLTLSYTEIRAPIDGTVGNRAAHAGAYATLGAPILSLVPADGLWVDANFKESQLAGMKPGQTVTLTADILPGQNFHGVVTSIAPATGAQFSVLPPENATGNFTKIVQRVPVRIRLVGDAARLGTLRPGLSVIAEVDRRRAS